MANSYSELWQFTRIETIRNGSTGTVSKLVIDIKEIEADRTENLVNLV